jgi:hypothetical protein
VEGEGGPRWRRAAAGAALVGGLFYGTVFSLRFGWYPYSWQWLAYHNGLVSLVSLFLLLPQESGFVWDEPPDKPPRATTRPRILFGSAIVVRRLGETWVSERIGFRPKGTGEEKRDLTARRGTEWSFGRKAPERTPAVLNPSRRGLRLLSKSRR